MISTFDKQIVRSLSRRRRWRAAKGPRIAVVGNCQAAGLAYSMKLLAPTILVDHFQLAPKARTPLKVFAKILARYDHVFSHEFSNTEINGGGSDDLRDLLDNLELMPSISFSAFHPDLIYLSGGPDTGLLRSPTGHYHSALAFLGWRQRYPVHETLALFNDEVMQTLGYFDLWPAAVAALEREGLKFGYNFDAQLLSWSRRGIFMYSINHPKAFVLLDLAKMLLSKLNVCFINADSSEYLFDRLSGGEIFPVYPQIGSYYGYPGSYVFRMNAFNIEKNNYEFMDLSQFIKSCYEIYNSFKSAPLHNDRVEKWLDNPEVSEILTKIKHERSKR